MGKRGIQYRESDYWLKRQALKWGVNLYKLDKYSCENHVAKVKSSIDVVVIKGVK